MNALWDNVWFHLVLGWTPWVVPTAAGFYLLRRYVRAAEGGAARRGQLEALRERLARLEEQQTAVAAEVEQLTEGHAFTARLLAERAEHGVGHADAP